MHVEVLQLETDECLSLDDVKLHCRVDSDAEDSWFTAKISAARVYVEKYIDSAVLPQTLIAYYDANEVYCLPQAFRLPSIPVISIASVNSYDSNNTETTLSENDYFLSGDRIALYDNAVWPSDLRSIDSMAIQFMAGMGYSVKEDNETTITQTVPENIKQAMLLLIGHWYQNREAAYDPLAKFEPQRENIPHGVSALLMPYRRFSL